MGTRVSTGITLRVSTGVTLGVPKYLPYSGGIQALPGEDTTRFDNRVRIPQNKNTVQNISLQKKRTTVVLLLIVPGVSEK